MYTAASTIWDLANRIFVAPPLEEQLQMWLPKEVHVPNSRIRASLTYQQVFRNLFSLYM